MMQVAGGLTQVFLSWFRYNEATKSMLRSEMAHLLKEERSANVREIVLAATKNEN